MLKYTGFRPRVKFDCHYLKQDKVTFTCKQILNNYFAYEIKLWSYTEDANFPFGNSLFGSVKLTKNVDSDKYSFFGIWY